MYIIHLRRLIKKITGTSLGVVDANRAIRKIPDGTNIGNAAMPLYDFVVRTMFDFASPIISSFTGGTTLEKGETTLTKTLSFTVTCPSGVVLSSIKIVGSVSGSSADLKSGTGTQSGTYNITLAADTNETFTITATSTDGKTAIDTESFTFKNKLYYGIGVDPGSYNEAFIKALAANSLDSDYMTAFTVVPGSGQYIWFACPKSYVGSPYLDPPYFFLGTSLPGGMQVQVSNVSYNYGTNTEDYVVFRSANTNLGSCDVIVSNSPSP